MKVGLRRRLPDKPFRDCLADALSKELGIELVEEHDWYKGEYGGGYFSYFLTSMVDFEQLEDALLMMSAVKKVLEEDFDMPTEIWVLKNGEKKFVSMENLAIEQAKRIKELEIELAGAREKIRRQVAPRHAHPGDKR